MVTHGAVLYQIIFKIIHAVLVAQNVILWINIHHVKLVLDRVSVDGAQKDQTASKATLWDHLIHTVVRHQIGYMDIKLNAIIK